eukprot:TRINITY_DN5477_c0_g2_i1.p1 TRINITY_DN5477_c0_g2~~TRINITY_DN5477_c0_g2_i1.p1  ORF type:complete len:128 (+),score=38.49 TRINITY_DN5477_c0_g2_i1:251-634(+)
MIDLLEDHKLVLQGKKPKGKPKRKKDKDAESSEDETPKKLPVSVESTENKIKQLEEKIVRLELKMKDKDQLKEVSTSTSKVNYIDPRITIAWCKKVGLDHKKVFSKTLRDKFAWAEADVTKNPDFVF